MSFDLSQYEPVEERIKRFYKDHEDGRITADLISAVDNMDVAIVKAFLYVGETLVSTGLAYEKNGEGFVNKTSHIENCETSAIGRALANFNYAGSKRPSREEMQKATESESPAPPTKIVDPKIKKLVSEITTEIKKHTFTDAELSTYRDEVKKATVKELKELLVEIKKAGANQSTTVSDPGLDAAFDGKTEGGLF